MHNTKIILSYDGSDFYGWQRQKDVRTVQQTLEEVLEQLSGGIKITCHASGRTDTGVHAVGQVVHFHSELRLPPEKLCLAMNSLLPADVVVRSVERVPDDFHATTSAKRKLYRYVINDARVQDVFLRKYAWFFPFHPLDHEKMHEAAQFLQGEHDFRCFETDWPTRKSSVRTITHIAVNRAGEFLWLDVEANGFLYNMVRAITGTLVQVGRGYWPVEKVKEILEGGKRTEAGPTAPPSGLFLMRVTY
ncbi:MAG TPA: tRNA pseudouridine(38-40) synthase TruA [Gemmatales bacterium]|nr:tRNA pseudouridine(38-40) synthase TruA [Gemmatales bacterium]HMP17666.1 tRNA pseudouridine(38-40) synthase TruA [Gemmatales bacterium]